MTIALGVPYKGQVIHVMAYTYIIALCCNESLCRIEVEYFLTRVKLHAPTIDTLILYLIEFDRCGTLRRQNLHVEVHAFDSAITGGEGFDQ